MFTIFIDDSGTAPEHKMTVAAGIVVPARQLQRLEAEWDAFLAKEQIQDFHASECLARNQHSAFASWDDSRVRRVFARVRQITFKYSVKGFCIGIHKRDYDEALTAEMKSAVGESHYTWAVSSVLGLADDWARAINAPMDYVFDNAEKSVKREIELALEFAETMYPGRFAGHYSFRSRKDVPSLQAVDLFAWTCYRQFLRARFGNPVNPIAAESDEAYAKAQNHEWRIVQSLDREGLERWVTENRENPRTQEIIEFRNKQATRKQGKGK